MKLKISALIILVISVLAIALFDPFQDIGKNEIRILIDRPPNHFQGQNSDVVMRRLAPLFNEFHYTLDPEASQNPSEEFTLIPPDPSHPRLRFLVYRDETSRALQFLRGRGDVLFDGVSLTKTRWIQKRGFRYFESPSFYLQCLGFNLKDPILKNLSVRKAIALALPIQEWIQHKYFDLATLSPDAPPRPDSEKAEALLERAGFKKSERGIRFSLKYLMTSVRESNELALLVREALAKIGIEVLATPIEISHFYSKLRRHDFQLMATGIYRSTEDESIREYFHPRGGRNFYGYDNPEIMKKEEAVTWKSIHQWVSRDLPCVPLFLWKHDLLLSDRMIAPASIPLDDSFRFLPALKLK